MAAALLLAAALIGCDSGVPSTVLPPTPSPLPSPPSAWCAYIDAWFAIDGDTAAGKALDASRTGNGAIWVELAGPALERGRAAYRALQALEFQPATAAEAELLLPRVAVWIRAVQRSIDHAGGTAEVDAVNAAWGDWYGDAQDLYDAVQANYGGTCP